MRSLKTKSGQGAKKTYIYHEHLQFLLAYQESSQTESSMLLDSNEVSKDVHEIESADDIAVLPAVLPAASTSCFADTNNKLLKNQKRSRNELNDIEKEIMFELKKPKMEEQKCTFFTSFESYVTDMSETEKLQLHMNILKCITDIKARRTQNVYVYECLPDVNIA